MKRHEKQIYPLYSFVFYQRRIGEAARNEKANEIIKHLKGLSADSPFYIDKGAWAMDWISALIASAVTGAVTFSVANKQTNGSVEQQYTENITKLFTFYKEQVDALGEEVRQLKSQIKDIENKYVKDINGYKLIVEKLEDEVEVLREENDELKIENAILKGDQENGI